MPITREARLSRVSCLLVPDRCRRPRPSSSAIRTTTVRRSAATVRPHSFDDFDLYRLTEEHELLRETRPRPRRRQDRAAGRRDRRDRRVPLGRLRGAGEGRTCTPSHVPEAVRRRRRRRARVVHRHRGGRPGLRVVLADPGGQQARHACRSCSPARRSSKQRYLPPLARGRGDVLLRAVRARGRQRRRGDEAPGRCATATAGCSTARSAGSPTPASPTLLHGDGRDRPRRTAPAASRRSSSRPTTRASASARRRRSSASRARRPPSSTSTTCASRPTG